MVYLACGFSVVGVAWEFFDFKMGFEGEKTFM